MTDQVKEWKSQIIKLEEEYEFATQWFESQLEYGTADEANETERQMLRMEADIDQLEYMIMMEQEK